jgi:predicted extracellular nuclease
MAFDKTFKIASFNCYNLVRPGVFYYDNPAYSDAEFAKKIAWSSALLGQTGADLVGFQEVFSAEALETLVAAVPAMAGATVLAPGAARDENEGPHPERPTKTKAIMPKVGLATTLEVLDHALISDFPDEVNLSFPRILPETGAEQLVALPIRQFQRPVLKARVMLANGTPATVLVAHLKSKRPSVLTDHGEEEDNPLHKALGAVRSLVIRAIEAAALRAIALSVIDDPDDAEGRRGEPLIVIGDLNDSERAVSTQVVAGDRPWIFAPFEQKKRIWDTLLYNGHDLQAEQSLSGHPYTHIFDGHYEILDHILLSQEFHRLFRDNVGEFRNLRVFNDHLVDSAQSDERNGRVVGDHGVPVAEVKLRELAPMG